LNLLESQFGKHPDIDRRRTKLAMLRGTDTEAAPATPDNVEYAEPAKVVVADSTPVEKAQVIDPGLAEVFEEYRASAEGEVNGNGDYETHYNLGLAYQEMDLFEEALEEFQVAIKMITPDDARHLQCCNLIGHCFLQKGVPQLAVKWFQKGLSAPTATEDERQA